MVIVNLKDRAMKLRMELRVSSGIYIHSGQRNGLDNSETFIQGRTLYFKIKQVHRYYMIIWNLQPKACIMHCTGFLN